MVYIYEQPGLTANLVFNLNNPRDDDPSVLSSQISIIGNMAFHLRRFQQSKYMIEDGTHNLIHVLTKLSEPKFKMKAAIAIRKATHCRLEELLDAFIAGGLIESIVKLVKSFGVEKLKEIQAKRKRTHEEQHMRNILVQCQCVII